MGLHWQELVILLIVALVIFGPKRLPDIGRSIGQGLREFKDGVSGREPKLAPVEVAAEDSTPVATDESDAR